MTNRNVLNPLRYRAGFSFTEILFSVIILGIGFIMVAAIFPVAIQQGKLSDEQTVAAGVAREALAVVGQIGSNSDSGISYDPSTTTFLTPFINTVGGPLFPATGVAQQGPAASPTLPAVTTGSLWSFRDPNITSFPQLNGTANAIGVATNRAYDYVWSKLSQNLISQNDPRYAFVGMYRRDGDPKNPKTWSPFAQVWLIPVTTRTRTVYDPTKDAAMPAVNTPSTLVNLAARVVQIEITDPTGAFPSLPSSNYVIHNYVTQTTPVSGYTPGAVVTGAYIIIARDNINAPTQLLSGFSVPAPIEPGRMNGRIFHVGARRPDLDGSSAFGNYQTYDLAADSIFAADPGVDGFFSTASNSVDDILAIGNPVPVGSTGSLVTASAPADAYVVGTDIVGDPGPAQDISAFTTFIKVN